MSPRSEEMLDRAARRVAAARRASAAGDHEVAVSLAYYASLYAARAALSERDLHARTHAGVWHLFHRHVVRDGGFDPELARRAAAAQDDREDVDYDARLVTPEEASSALDVAERFVAAVAALR